MTLKILTKPLYGTPSGPPGVISDPTLIIRKTDTFVLDFSQREISYISQQTESEYFTVTYKVTMTRKWKRMLLQTYLDSILRRENLHLTFADFLIIEDLIVKIRRENEERQDPDAEKQIFYDAELLYIAELFLRDCPVNSPLFHRPGLVDFRDKILQLGKECMIFKFSDERTYRSRVQTYHPSKFLEITVVVPLPSEGDNRTSQRYSSYTKGHPTPGRRGAAPLPLYLQKALGDSEELNPQNLLVPLQIFWKALSSPRSDENKTSSSEIG